MACRKCKTTFKVSMKYMIGSDTFFGESGLLCYITNNDTSMYNVTDIDESMQGSPSTMPAIKKGKQHVDVWQLDGTKCVYTLLPVKCCPRAGASQFSQMCELLQGNKISSKHRFHIVVSSTNDKIILYCWIRTHDGWVTGVKWEGIISYSRIHEEHQWPTHWTWTSFWNHYLCHHYNPQCPSYWLIQTMWRLCSG